MSVSGYITFATTLPPSTNIETPFTPTDFSFSDGLQTLSYYDSPSSLATDVFDFTTDASGSISSWFILVSEGHSGISSRSDTTGGFDQATFLLEASADTVDRPGSWASSPIATPLPSALPLLFTGIGFLGLLCWRTKRKNAAAIAA